MPRIRSKFNLVKSWISSIQSSLNKSIKIRKYYSAEELHAEFCNDIKDHGITTVKSFKIHLNKCIHTELNLHKKESSSCEDRYNSGYIILKDGDTFNHNQRISKHRRSPSTPPSSTERRSPSTPPFPNTTQTSPSLTSSESGTPSSSQSTVARNVDKN